MSKLRLVRRECAVAGTPSSTLDRHQRKSRLPHQGTRHSRRAMDELGAALRRISKFLSRQWVDASTASISRLEDGHLFAGDCDACLDAGGGTFAGADRGYSMG